MEFKALIAAAIAAGIARACWVAYKKYKESDSKGHQAAYKEGALARSRHIARESNPHTGEKLRVRWDRGWDDQNKKREDYENKHLSK